MREKGTGLAETRPPRPVSRIARRWSLNANWHAGTAIHRPNHMQRPAVRRNSIVWIGQVLPATPRIGALGFSCAGAPQLSNVHAPA